jgi:transcriptional regulator with PAS, ATPase and Fis domain
MLGDNEARTMDVRVVAATNRSLSARIAEGRFREDLYYRLDVLPVYLPPLREHGDDLLLLTRHFLEKHTSERDGPRPDFSDQALAALRKYRWPGNVRELENLIRRLLVMGDSAIINVTDFPEELRFAAPRSVDIRRTLADVEHEHIHRVLRSTNGNRTRAAKVLGIHRETLRRKLARPRD